MYRGLSSFLRDTARRESQSSSLSHCCELIQEPFLPKKMLPLLSLRRLCLGKAKTTSVPTAHSPGIWKEEEQLTIVRAKEDKNFPFHLLVSWVSAHEFQSSDCSSCHSLLMDCGANAFTRPWSSNLVTLGRFFNGFKLQFPWLERMGS